jgi:HK97 family phage major capsid protein
MEWSNFIEQLRSQEDYAGEDDDFDAVVKHLKSKGHDTEKVTTDDGEVITLRKLFDDRPGKMLNVSKAKEQAAFKAAVEAAVEAKVGELEASLAPAKKGAATKTKEHNITVGKDLLVDHPKGGYGRIGEFYKDVRIAGTDSEGTPEKLALWQKATLSTYGADAVGVDGGFAAPAEMRDAITSRVMGEDSILSRCDQIPLDSSSVTFPDDETTPWQTSGGVLAYWAGEAGTMSQSKPALLQKTLTPRKVYCLVPVTEELLEDASAMGSYITRKAGEKLDFKIGEAIFRGTGAGQPLGFMNSPSLVTVDKIANQTADTITGRNIVTMFSRMYAPWRNSAVWFVGGNTEPQLAELAFGGKTAGGTPTTSWGVGGLYVPPGGLSQSPYATLLGKPVINTQHCMELGDLGDIVFASMPQYVCAIKSGGVEGSSSIHLWFDQDAVAFKFRARVDGQPWLSNQISPRAGSYVQAR